MKKFAGIGKIALSEPDFVVIVTMDLYRKVRNRRNLRYSSYLCNFFRFCVFSIYEDLEIGVFGEEFVCRKMREQC